MSESSQTDGRDSSSGAESILASRAATLHYKERKTNLTIAKEMGISRFRVARLLDQAIAEGIVQISIAAPFGDDPELSEALRNRYGLEHALVLPASEDEDGDRFTKRGVSALAANFLQQVLRKGNRIGVSWGSTMDSVAYAMETIPTFPQVDIVQMIGGITTLKGSLHASELLRRLAAVTGGQTYALHAPLILPDAETAQGLRAEKSVARTLGMISKVDVAVVGVGSWNPRSSGLVEVLSERDVAGGLAENVVADICGVLFNAHGSAVAGSISDRMISATIEDLRAIPLRLAVATGQEKAPALQVVLKAGVINALATDAQTARALLAPATNGIAATS